jgi:murein DD-endopeptidase MepM/ murein hydrolase activator NlpD
MARPFPVNKYQNLKAGVLTTPFGGRTAFEAQHPGVDIANQKGTPIKSTTEGVVTKVTNGLPQGQGFGNQVHVKDNSGNTHVYSHLHKGFVRPGARIQKGQQIAAMGNSGAAYSKSGQGDGTHVDYRIVNAYGKYLNPSGYIKNL